MYVERIRITNAQNRYKVIVLAAAVAAPYENTEEQEYRYAETLIRIPILNEPCTFHSFIKSESIQIKILIFGILLQVLSYSSASGRRILQYLQ